MFKGGRKDDPKACFLDGFLVLSSLDSALARFNELELEGERHSRWTFVSLTQSEPEKSKAKVKGELDVLVARIENLKTQLDVVQDSVSDVGCGLLPLPGIEDMTFAAFESLGAAELAVRENRLDAAANHLRTARARFEGFKNRVHIHFAREVGKMTGEGTIP